MSPSESNCSTSFGLHNVDQPSTQTSQSTIDSQEAESGVPSRDCHDTSAPPSPPTKKPSEDGTRKSARFGSEINPGKSSSIAAASLPIEGPRGVLAEKVPAERFVSVDPQSTGRKRVFDEIEELALPSSQSSRVRLSMTLDGAVKVRTTDEETPSPPKQRPQNLVSLRKEGLRRSQSAIAASELFKEGRKNRARPTSGIFGRSRDARTWEFYCDGDARATLSAQAENENKGSAVGAINLIRSQSQNAKSKAPQRRKETALTPRLGAGNARRQAAPTKQKPKMVRSMSSMARLASDPKDDNADVNKSGKASHARSPSGDSDKENWAPGTRSSTHHLRRTQPSSSASGRVLQDHAPATSMGHPHARNKHSGCDQGSAPSETDCQQADRFTHNEEKEEDLDCIQGLLSLSQGAWK